MNNQSCGDQDYTSGVQKGDYGSLTYMGGTSTTIKSTILHEIAGKRYVLIERIFYMGGENKEWKALCRACNGFVQAMKPTDKERVFVLTMLIPEEKIITFFEAE